jgi:hypothetical protein
MGQNIFVQNTLQKLLQSLSRGFKELKMKYKFLFIFFLSLIVIGCKKHENLRLLDDLNSIKNDFVASILQESDGPIIVKIPYELLKDQWNPVNPLANVLPKVIASKSYTSSWDEGEFFENLLSESR